MTQRRVPVGFLFQCAACGQEFERPGSRGTLPTYCRPCRRLRDIAKNKAWAARNPEKVAARARVRFERENNSEGRARRARMAREKRLRDPERYRQLARGAQCRKYGITLDWFTAQLGRQGNRCAICRTDEPGGRHNQWHIDHDHTSGTVRGVLCNDCNTGLGRFNDDQGRMRAAIRYLRSHTKV